MEHFIRIVKAIDDFVWGPVMLILLIGTGVILTVRLHFLPWRNLKYALHSVLSKKSRTVSQGNGDISPFSALMTTLAATIGTGNIIGVATAMVSGGPGALVWMWISACFGLSTTFSECMLASKYRTTNDKGEMIGGPMFTMKYAFQNKSFGSALGFCFAFFTAIASFGIGNMTQSNSIADSMKTGFGIPPVLTGMILTIVTFSIILGGITSISKVSSVLVPTMAIAYTLSGFIVILFHIRNLPAGLTQIFIMAFYPKAIRGGVLGTVTVSVIDAMRFGVSRGVFSNEAGLGSAAITAAAATSDDPIRQGYINMTGTFFDTIVICSITGLSIATSGVLGSMGADGKPLNGVELTMAAFSSVLGPFGSYLVGIGIILFAFSTIIGWEYQGEKAFEYLVQDRRLNFIYRIIFSLITFIGATQELELVWNLSDIMNALMAVPNLICLLLLSGEVAKDIQDFQKIIQKETFHSLQNKKRG